MPSKIRYASTDHGLWVYRRRVPKDFTALDQRGIAKAATGVRVADDPNGRIAGPIIERLNTETESYWRGLAEGQAAEARRRYDAAVARARALGLAYLPASEVAALDLPQLLARVDMLTPDRLSQPSEVAAVLGGETPQAFTAGEVFDEYRKISAADLAPMSADQVRRWENAKRHAAAMLVAQVGASRPLAAITRADAIELRAALEERVLAGEVQAETANKQMGHIRNQLSALDRRFRLGLDDVFAGLAFRSGPARRRVAYDTEFITGTLLAPGALAGLNREARLVVLALVNTGLRISEALNLDASTIRLDTAVPHVRVLPDGRVTKSDSAVRAIPLAGCSLDAFKAAPEGFARYRDKAAGLSGTVNKYLAENGLRPVDGQSLYSLRHSFQDRLIAVEAPERVQADLMGHKTQRPKYGQGPSLEQLAVWIGRVALP